MRGILLLYNRNSYRHLYSLNSVYIRRVTNILKEGNSSLFKVAKGLFTCVRRSVILLKDKGLNIILEGI